MAKLSRTELETQLLEYICTQLKTGFHSPAEIVESANEIYSDDADPDELQSLAHQLLDSELPKQLDEQSKWTEKTDCDRLDVAFDELCKAGIVARQNFSCCGNCGVAEIGAEFETEEEQGITVRGYTFYHMQDTENAASGCVLYLNYGSVECVDEASLAIAEEIVLTLESHGLRPIWNGDIGQRIGVNMDWKRRIPMDEA